MKPPKAEPVWSNDFTMCNNPVCPYASTCARNPASGTKPDRWQSWAMFAPDVSGICANRTSPRGRQDDINDLIKDLDQ